MPKTATKRESAADSVAATLDSTFAGMTADAVLRWRSWATAVADGDRSPADPREIVEVALTLGIRDPGAALAKDAEAIAGVRVFETRRQAAIEADRKEIAEHGGHKAIAARIAELTKEIGELKRISSCGRSWTASEWAKAATKIRRETPRIFANDYQGDIRR